MTLTSNVFGSETEISFVAETPVAMTAPGQSPEIAIVDVVTRRFNLEIKIDEYLEPEGLSDIKTLMIILGGSGKGLGSAGVKLPEEIDRAKRLITECKEKGINLIGIHIGGAERRGESSQVMIDLITPECDFVVVRSDGNLDGVFDKICEENNIPFVEIERTPELAGIIKDIFQIPD